MYGTALDVELANALESVGVNFAVSECEPAVSVLFVIWAMPPATAAVPSAVAPSKNCTDPAADEGDTVAFSVSVRAPGSVATPG